METWDTWSPPSTSEGSPRAEAACSSFLGLLEQNTIIWVFPFTVLAARNLKMRCQQCWFLVGVLRENPGPLSQLLVLPAVLGISWLVDTSLMLQCVLTCSVPCLGPALTPYGLLLTSLHLQWLYFQTRSHSEVLGLSPLTCLFGEYSSPRITALACFFLLTRTSPWGRKEAYSWVSKLPYATWLL